MDKKTGFVKRPTFAELAQLEQKVTYSKPIIRDATAYWNSFDSAWLKGPLDEVSNRAFLAQQRQAIQQAAINAGRSTGVSPAQVMGTMDRAFNKPHRLDTDEINVQTDGIVSSYYNPAQDHNVRESQEMQRQREFMERMMRENEERDRRASGADAFEEGLGSSATRESFARRAFDFLVPEGTAISRAVVEGVSLSVEGIALAADLIMRAAGAGASTFAASELMARFSPSDQTAIRAELARRGAPAPSLRGGFGKPPPRAPPPPPARRADSFIDYYAMLDTAARVPGLNVALLPYTVGRAAGRGYRAVDDAFLTRRRGDEPRATRRRGDEF